MSKAAAWGEARVSEPVTLINAFSVPQEETEHFLDRWKSNARIMARQSGFLRARLHRSLDVDAEWRFVNVAQWDSGTALDHALANPQWRTDVQRFLEDPALHFISRPVVYQVTIDVQPGDAL